jgi:threonine synthase
MKYISTRGGIPEQEFSQVVLMGLADDGGLILPNSYPDVSGNLVRWQTLSFQQLAVEVLLHYVDIPRDSLQRLINTSFSTFQHPDITPLVTVGRLNILELFHGPTLAFKDVALQFLGNLFEYTLAKSRGELNIVVATSGDTGSAAIEAVRGRRGMRIFVLHPKGRVSPLQERQMTSVLDTNVFNIAIEGSFDDCQSLVKGMLQDVFFKQRYSLGSVNSINWARILAQLVYYFYACGKLSGPNQRSPVSFAVPTGNFGDIFAGYVAHKMGAPIRQLILGTNENDILARFFNSGRYSLGAVHQTISPSMDIQIASNLERFLFHAVDNDPARLKSAMASFATKGDLTLDLGSHARMFKAGSSDRRSTLETIRRLHSTEGYTLDPHTAVGVTVGERLWDHEGSLVALATAHPSKFPDAVREATGLVPTHPTLDRLAGLPTRCQTLPASLDVVRAYVESSLH